MFNDDAVKIKPILSFCYEYLEEKSGPMAVDKVKETIALVRNNHAEISTAPNTKIISIRVSKNSANSRA
jgi:hypothetical protein